MKNCSEATVTKHATSPRVPPLPLPSQAHDNYKRYFSFLLCFNLILFLVRPCACIDICYNDQEVLLNAT